MRRIDPTIGHKFGSLTVIGEAYSSQTPSSKAIRFVRCRCICGFETEVRTGNLKNGNSRSCGKCEVARTARAAGRTIDDDSSSFKGAYAAYRRRSTEKGIDFCISTDLFRSITKMRCHYCGCEPSNRFGYRFSRGPRVGQPRAGLPYIYSGIDRIDSRLGYVEGNIRPSCLTCNRAKADLSEGDFLAWLKRVTLHLEI